MHGPTRKGSTWRQSRIHVSHLGLIRDQACKLLTLLICPNRPKSVLREAETYQPNFILKATRNANPDPSPDLHVFFNLRATNASFFAQKKGARASSMHLGSGSLSPLYTKPVTLAFWRSMHPVRAGRQGAHKRARTIVPAAEGRRWRDG